MSKFCVKCGAAAECDAGFCTQCGTAFNLRVKKHKKSLTIIVAAVAVAMAIGLTGVVAFWHALNHFLSSSPAFMEPVHNYFEVIYDGKAEDVEKLVPEECFAIGVGVVGQTREDIVKAAKRWADADHKTLVNCYGEDFTYSYAVTKNTAMTEEELEKMAKSLEEVFGIDPDTVKKGHTLRVDVVISDGEPKEMEFIVVQIGNVWYRVAWLENYNVFLGQTVYRAYFPIGYVFSYWDY